MTSRFLIDKSPEIWNNGMRAWSRALDAAIHQTLDSRRPDIDQWMQQNAPWKDVTGAARSSLHTVLDQGISEYIITFGFGSSITYARYLEYDHGGKFAIIAPAMDYWLPILMDDIQAILG